MGLASGRSGIAGPPRCVCAGPPAGRLDRRQERPDRLPLGRRQRRSHAQAGRGTGRSLLPKSSWPIPARRSRRCCRRAAPFRSCSRWSPIRSAPATSSNLARPGGNVTGFTNFEYSIGGKWLELLKEIAPNVKRVAVLRESFVASGPGQFGAIQAASHSLGVEVRPLDLRDAGEIERDINCIRAGFGWRLDRDRQSGGDRPPELIYALALRHRLPVVYNSRFYVSSGGLISYGPDFVDQFRRAAAYVDQILRGAEPCRPCRCRRRSSTNSRSTRKSPKHWGSSSQPACSAAPTM